MSKKKKVEPVLNLDNEEFLGLLLAETDKSLEAYRELEEYDASIAEAIRIRELRREYIIEKYKENGFEIPGQRRRARA